MKRAFSGLCGVATLLAAAGCGDGSATPDNGANGAEPAIAVADSDRSGPSERRSCQIGGGAPEPCVVTPLFGDGSFELSGERETVRLLIEGDEAQVFAVFSPEHRVPTGGTFRRDPADPACWTDEDPEREPGRICVR
ncbi:MAG: hypothetical protein ACK4K7_11750 [Allosphingosinicella sp.]|uniref:hypothetical protein n=1 Tax=Allosphingosinicella sp. TaxID=2823234 RepID=UPI0039222A7D